MLSNKVILLGRIGGDPEKKEHNGNSITNLSVATSETYKDKNGEKVTKTEWHKVVVYGKRADVIEQYFKKGDLIFLEGSLETRQWEDKDGNKRYTTSVKMNNFEFVANGNSNSNDSQKTSNAPSDDDNDDLPF